MWTGYRHWILTALGFSNQPSLSRPGWGGHRGLTPWQHTCPRGYIQTMGNEGRERLATSWDAEGCLCIASILPGQLQKGQKRQGQREEDRENERWMPSPRLAPIHGASQSLCSTTRRQQDWQVKKHYGSLINQSPLQAVKEMQQSMMTSLPGRGGGRKN